MSFLCARLHAAARCMHAQSQLCSHRLAYVASKQFFRNERLLHRRSLNGVLGHVPQDKDKRPASINITAARNLPFKCTITREKS